MTQYFKMQFNDAISISIVDGIRKNVGKKFDSVEQFIESIRDGSIEDKFIFGTETEKFMSLNASDVLESIKDSISDLKVPETYLWNTDGSVVSRMVQVAITEEIDNSLEGMLNNTEFIDKEIESKDVQKIYETIKQNNSNDEIVPLSDYDRIIQLENSNRIYDYEQGVYVHDQSPLTLEQEQSR